MGKQMTTKRKPDHYCIQEDTIQQLKCILVGKNGNPEEGILFKINVFMDEHGKLLEDISEIKEGVNGLHARADENKAAASTVASALDKYKSEISQFEAGKEALRVKRNLTVSRIIQISAICISLFMAWIGYRNLTKHQQSLQKNVNEIRYELAPERNAKPAPLDPDKVIRNMK
jgi:predicted  nucleic acid-binding Zn-ribbon protein